MTEVLAHRVCFSVKCPFEQALAAALSVRDSGRRVFLSGKLLHITPPDGIDKIELNAWQGACLLYCASNQIEVALHATRGHPEARAVDFQKAAFAVSLATGILIERVRQERSKIARETRAERTGYVCGRPPYGYRVVDGEFAIDPAQKEAVVFIFQSVSADEPLNQIVSELKQHFGYGGPVRGRPQFWDRVKIRRILNHARLYCLGEYTGGRVKSPVTIPELAFLPTSWLTSVQTRPKAQKDSP